MDSVNIHFLIGCALEVQHNLAMCTLLPFQAGRKVSQGTPPDRGTKGLPQLRAHFLGLAVRVRVWSWICVSKSNLEPPEWVFPTAFITTAGESRDKKMIENGGVPLVFLHKGWICCLPYKVPNWEFTLNYFSFQG